MPSRLELLIPPPIVGLLCACLMWVLSSSTLELALTFQGQKTLALVIAGVGLSMDVVSVFAFLKARTTITPLKPEKAQALVTSGFYRFTRNPMYLGMLLMLVGYTFWTGHPLAAIGPVLFVTYITYFQIKPEEVRLGALFGQDYHTYCAQVRRWI